MDRLAQKKSPDALSEAEGEETSAGEVVSGAGAPRRSGGMATPAATYREELPSGWAAAAGYRDIDEADPSRPIVRERAVEAVLVRAKHLLRHGARPAERLERSWPAEGELDLERTLARPRPWTAADLRVVRRQPLDVDVVAVLDMSLSMTGEKVALLAVAAAILRLKLERLGVVAFDSEAHPLTPAGSTLPARAVIRKVLEVPARGYTNIHAGLSLIHI